MDSIHEEYLNGEIIYAGKLDTLKIRPGYYRAQLEGYTQFLGTSNQIIIEFDDEMLSFPIAENLSDIYSVIIEELDEGSYEFDVYTQDPNGNLSISQTVSGNVIGDEFILDQNPREVLDYSFEPEGNYVNFYGNAESEFVIYTLLDYENEEDEIVRDTLFFEDNRVKLINLKPLGSMQTTSVIQSGLNGIDSIALEPQEYTLPDLPYTELNKDFIRLVHMPSDNPGTFNGANPDQYLFDGDGSFNGVDLYSFHSGPSSMPHHFTVDLGVKTDLRKVKLNMLDPSINSSNNITEVQIWGRDNLNFAETSSSDEIEFINASWQLLYEGNVDGLNEQTSSFIIPQASSLMRYIRVRVTESVGNDSAQFTELSFYGENTEPIELDRTQFTMANMSSDNPGTFYEANPSQYLWDNNSFWSGDTNSFHSGENSVPGHFTIDLGVITQLAKAKIHYRPTWSFSGNNPTEIEIWGRQTIEGAETLPEFESSGNNVTSVPVATGAFEDAGWQLITTQQIDGVNSDFAEFDIPEGPMSRYIRIRFTSTVEGNSCQFIEMAFNGMGAIPSN
tara:strand:+ start:1181 stop:2860 length:1680 start_codon:yes stop_codon:yes gene_type:complete